jgi:transposase
LARLYRLVVGKDPRQLQFPFGLWTKAMVRELIKREFGVGLSEVSVGRLLRSLGLSPQRPVYRAYQQDPEVVRRWRELEYPRIRAEAQKAGAEIYFADEAAVRSDHHAGTSWAPVGKTPVVTSTGARFSLNLMSAVSPKGFVRFRILPARLTAPVFIDFCRRLVHDVGRPVFLVVDSHPVHRSHAVARYVDATEGRLRLFFLPPYSPQLNPDEWVWRNVKGHRLGRSQVAGPDDLRRKVLSALHRLQRLPGVVQGFFRDPALRYILQ